MGPAPARKLKAATQPFSNYRKYLTGPVVVGTSEHAGHDGDADRLRRWPQEDGGGLVQEGGQCPLSSDCVSLARRRRCRSHPVRTVATCLADSLLMVQGPVRNINFTAQTGPNTCPASPARTPWATFVKCDLLPSSRGTPVAATIHSVALFR